MALASAIITGLLWGRPSNYSAALRAPGPPRPRTVKIAIDLIEAAPEGSWTVTALAREAGVSATRRGHFHGQSSQATCQPNARDKSRVKDLAITVPRAVSLVHMTGRDQPRGTWTLLTGHGHVLVEIARHPGARIRDISPVVGLTERSVQAIVADLEAEGYLIRTRTGRRVVYTVNRDSPFRHSAQDGHRIGPFLDLLITTGPEVPPRPDGS